MAPFQHSMFLQILSMSVGLGLTLGLGVFPTTWFAFKFATGSTLEDSVYPGSSADPLVGVMLLGSLCLAALMIWAFLNLFSGPDD